MRWAFLHAGNAPAKCAEPGRTLGARARRALTAQANARSLPTRTRTAHLMRRRRVGDARHAGGRFAVAMSRRVCGCRCMPSPALGPALSPEAYQVRRDSQDGRSGEHDAGDDHHADGHSEGLALGLGLWRRAVVHSEPTAAGVPP